MDKSRGSSYVILKDNLVSLRKDLCRTDLDEFLSLEKQGKRAEEAGDPGTSHPLLQIGNRDLRWGIFLPEDLYETWAEVKRYQLRTVYIDLLYRAAGLYEAQGKSRKAIEYYRMIIKTDPICEAAYQKLMLIYSNGGMRAEALMVYDGVAVIAKNTWAAIKGRNALKIVWKTGRTDRSIPRSTRRCLKSMCASPAGSSATKATWTRH